MLILTSYHRLTEAQKSELGSVSKNVQIIEIPAGKEVDLTQILKEAKQSEHVILIASLVRYPSGLDYDNHYFNSEEFLHLVCNQGEAKLKIGSDEANRGYNRETKTSFFPVELGKLPDGILLKLVELFDETWKQPSLL